MSVIKSLPKSLFTKTITQRKWRLGGVWTTFLIHFLPELLSPCFHSLFKFPSVVSHATHNSNVSSYKIHISCDTHKKATFIVLSCMETLTIWGLQLLYDIKIRNGNHGNQPLVTQW